MRSRDYCTTSRHVVSMCLSVVRTALELGNFVHVANYVAKAEQAPDVPVRVHMDSGRGFISMVTSCPRVMLGMWQTTW